MLLALVVPVLAGCLSLGDDPAPQPKVRSGPDVPDARVDFSWDPVRPFVGDAVVFEPFGSIPEGQQVTSWRWDFGDGESSTVGAPIHRFGDVGLYTVSVRMAVSDGQVARAANVVQVTTLRQETGGPATPEEEAAVSAEPPVIFHAVDDVAVRFWFEWSLEAEEVVWSFGDGDVSNDPTPTHTFPAPGQYTVRVTVRVGEVVREAGTVVEVTKAAPRFRLSDLGVDGAEPSVGVTSSGCIFYAAFHRVMRSCDLGLSWDQTQDIFSQPTTSDPWLWVDEVTDRIFNVQMVSLACTWIAWSDDDGDSWLGNPWDCGPIPVNDHIKLGSGPWVEEGLAGYQTLGKEVGLYPRAVYFCYNKLAGVFCYTSFDGGLTFPVGGSLLGLAGTGGLHGAITAGSDGAVYVPPRLQTPTVYISHDNGLSWSSATMGRDVGTPSPRKNSEVATDQTGFAYHTWVGADQGVYLSRSGDSGRTWEQTSIRVSPPEVVSAAFPHATAGSRGRVAFTYLGSEDAAAIGTPDIDGEPWDGNPHTAPDHVQYHLYVAISLSGRESEPGFATYRVTDDPVQVGSICISSGDCRDIGGSNRNLLDFNDLHIDRAGRIYVAYADGCTGACATDPAPTAADSRDRRAMVALLESGPSLYEDRGWLTAASR